MRLYIQTSKILRKFNLPAKIDGSMLFSFKLEENGLMNSINIDAINNQWVLKTNGNVNIIGNDGNFLPEMTLRDYMFVPVSITGVKELVCIFCLPSIEDYQNVYDVQGIEAITIGKSTDNNIVYCQNMMDDHHAALQYSKEHWFVVPKENDPNCYVFVNNQRVTEPTSLLAGDIIFMNGLRLIWMQKFFIIPMDTRLFRVTGLRAIPAQSLSDNTEYSSVSEVDNNITLYSEDEYFSHTPRIRSILEEEVVEIEAPPENKNDDTEMPFLLSIGSSFTMLGMMSLNAINLYDGLSSGTKDFMDLLPQIIMVVSMLIGSMLIPFVTKRWQKKAVTRKEEERTEKYIKYIDAKEAEVDAIKKKQEQVVIENYMDYKACLQILDKKTRSLWNRAIRDDDFLEIRVGIGDRPSKIVVSAPKESYNLDDDKLYSRVVEMGKRYQKLNDVPITINFKNQIVTSLIMETTKQEEFINGVILQFLTLHSPLDLKLCIFTDDIHSYQWNYLKYTNHIWSDDHDTRFFATNQEEAKSVSQFLANELKERKEKKSEKEKENSESVKEKVEEYALYDNYYLIITDNYRSIRNLQFFQELLGNEYNFGFSLIIIDKDMKNIPNACKKFLVIDDVESGMFSEKVSGEDTIRFKADFVNNLDMRLVGKSVGNIPVKGKDGESQLPTSLSFMEMFNVGKIEQLNARNRWAMSDPMTSLATCVGVHTSGEIFNLDLHEKHDGPHGLIAGSTGSGKSEFIITYILSMALNYDPKEVQFVLIDYKGGGLAGAFENREAGIAIPHLAGTITNLDTAEMNRALVSIESELKRRQKQFNIVKEKLGESTMDIYKYQRLFREGLIDEPISHLFIISDEFAELKAQQPDFMAQLVSTARIGRSLGVHLILATQKPSGVVNDQIWSNSRFKVCLKVQTKADSTEMLKRPEAASLKEAGRFYLQVGYDEYFDIGQSGWSGDKYVPTERIIKKVDDSIVFVNHFGNAIKKSVEIQKDTVKKEDLGDQLTNIVRYLNKIAVDDHFVPRKLWLPSLRKEIKLSDLLEQYKDDVPEINTSSIRAVIGEYDAPMLQEQGLFSMDFVKDGNLLIIGAPGSGKENLIFTIIYYLTSKMSPDEINFYIGDFGSETLKLTKPIPHVGDVFVTDEAQKMMNFIQMINKELERRKKDYSEFGGNYAEYCRLSGKKDPLIVTILNNYEVFLDTYPKLFDIFSGLFRDGSKFGLVFIVTSTQNNAVRGRLVQNFLNKICMKLADPSLYRDILGAPKGMVPVDTFGRGIYNVDGEFNYEFQTANVCDLDNRTMFFKDYGKELSKKYKECKKVRPIPVLPEIAYVDDVMFELKDLKCVPIGIEKNSLEVYVYDFLEQKINLIASKSIKNHIYFIYALIRQMITLKDVQVHVIDALSIYRGKYEHVDLYTDNLEDAFLMAYKNAGNDAKLKEKHVYFILGVHEFKKKVSKYSKNFESLFTQASKCKNNTFLFFDDSDSYKFLQVEDWYRNNINNTFGIWLGAEVDSQITLSVMSLTIDDRNTVFPCIGYPIYQGKHMTIKYVVDGVDKEDEQ